MSEYWLKALEEAEQAEAEAKRMRARYGPDAERRIDELIRDGAARASRRGEIEAVRKALRWT